MNSAITRKIIGTLVLATATTLAQETNSVTPPKSSVAGQEYTHPIRYEIYFPKEANKSTKEVYRVWIPEKIKQVRAVIVVSDYQNDKEMYFSEILGCRQFAERMEFALMAYRIFNECSDKTRDEATKDMLLALESIAQTSGHPIVKDPEFIMQWITAITRKRLPSPLTFDKAPSLTPLARESGWLGTFNYEHHWKPDGKFDRFEIKPATIIPFAQFKGDPGTAHWLPDEALAKAWKAKMGF